MIPRTLISEGLSELAEKQAGALCREQIRVAGISDDVIGRFVRSGQWSRLAQGVYATSPDSWLQRVWVGLLIGGEAAVVGRFSAARLWNLPVDSSRYPSEPPIEIYVGSTHRSPASEGHWHFIRGDRTGELSPSRTSIAQTIVDIADTLNGNQIAALVGQALGRKRVQATQIQAALDQTTRHRQRHLLTSIVSDAADAE